MAESKANYTRLPSKSNNFVETIRIISSKEESVAPERTYAVFEEEGVPYFFDKNAKKVLLDRQSFTWELFDNVVMIVKVTSSYLDSIQVGGIYQVYDDSLNDERYIIDDNQDKVLFDMNIFKCEVL